MNEILPNTLVKHLGAGLTNLVYLLPRQILVERFRIQAESKEQIEISCEQERFGFFVCLSGENRITLKEAGEVIYIRKGVCGAYHEPEGLLNTAVYGTDEPFSILSITMPPEALETVFSKGKDARSRLFQEKTRFPNRPYAVRFFSVQPLINTAVSQILTPPVDPDLFPVYLEGKVLEIISLMLQTLCARDSSPDFSPSLNGVETAKLFHARTLLDEYLETPPSLIEIAGQCGLGVDRMNRGFKELFGRTTSQYLRDRRMEKARSLLASGDCNVTDACLQVGYSNLSHFAKLYRNYFGHSPVKDRKQFFPAS
jgi:AraC-like DNA-binding protein